ncbi:PAS domain-containing protein [Faecalicoccus pleomorphus]|uniref:PAS domain-containing protein n=1 Tax=Faecalicoccus pleomorphus TaxID=1323 RepID=A0AAW6CV22_9FIRM|nr:PAS domain-containing protein [Faecalicoccus pleomorphus]MDB7979371.1 PAS domain-containing protein [Faecalicoccus pleomorphus]MDB7981497.1 PAS domain-containing protein [Faecalicoccus pleomorphus]
MENKIERLIAYVDQLLVTDDKVALYESYKDTIESIQPKDIFLVQNHRIKNGLSHEEALKQVPMLMNLFGQHLEKYIIQDLDENTFLGSLLQENECLDQYLLHLQKVIIQLPEPNAKKQLIERVCHLDDYDKHMKKLENILFPFLEKKDPCFEGVSLMWSMNNKAREILKKVKLDLEQNCEESTVQKDLGELYVTYSSLIVMQKRILIPCAKEEMDDKTDKKLLQESFEYGFSFMDEPNVSFDQHTEGTQDLPQGYIDLQTGRMNVEQLIGVFSSLPVDITFVDEHDKVAFFSKPKDRIFARSVSVIGRNVRNCHPSASVHIVEDILEGFKSGKRQSESFWIQMRGQFILIQYFSVRNDQGKYLGCLEVSQEISHIKKLEGEKRLLDR